MGQISLVELQEDSIFGLPLLFLAIGMKKWEVVFIKLKIPFEISPEMKWLLYIEIVLHLFVQSERQKMMQIWSNVSVLLNKNVHSKTKSHILKCYFGFMEM